MWAEAISCHIQESQTKLLALNPIAPSKHFYKYATLSENDFIENAKSGDMLLFRYNHLLSEIGGMITGATFHHVAIVVRNTNNLMKGEVEFFEAVSTGA